MDAGQLKGQREATWRHQQDLSWDRDSMSDMSKNLSWCETAEMVVTK